MIVASLALRLLCCTAAPASVSHAAPSLPAALANDNRVAAGTLRDGVLTLSLVAQEVEWRLLESGGPAVRVQAFGEESRLPSVPGPLVRVPIGTRVEIALRNSLADTLVFHWRCAVKCPNARTTSVAPGAIAQLAYAADTAGTFVYYAGTVRNGRLRFGAAQLAGVIVVDSAGARQDRILVVTDWVIPKDSANPSKGLSLAFALNGKLWPHTERLSYAQGDSVHWRLVHLGGGEHPMHLHGFYFRVESRGDGAVDTPIAPENQSLVVTQELGTLQTATVSWVGDRPGNWLFHCHKSFHSTRARNTDAGELGDAAAHTSGNHATMNMGGLVMGITVRPASALQPVAGPPADVAKRLRLLVQRREHHYGEEAGYGYVLQQGSDIPKRDSLQIPGPTLVLTRGERSAITVVNYSGHATAVHWHGIELESFFDGVAGWSGAVGRMAPMIAPNDSFVAVFSPRRAGTFIYHTHVDDMRQLGGGLYGALVVLEPGEKWNDATDHAFAIGQGGNEKPGWTVVNGVPAGDPTFLKAGVPHRLRFLSMTIDEESDILVANDSGPLQWKPLAKDGMPVPASVAKLGPARLHIGPGETYDFEITPARGIYWMRVMSKTNSLFDVIVR